MNYKYPNEYRVDCGGLGSCTVEAHSHSQAKYRAFLKFKDAGISIMVWNDKKLNFENYPLDLLSFSHHVTSVQMTHKSVLNERRLNDGMDKR